MSERRVDRAVFLVRRVGLLVLVVGCLVVPVVSIAANILGPRPHGSSTQALCADPTTPCELPQVIPTGRAAGAYHAAPAAESVFGRLGHLNPLIYLVGCIAVACIVIVVRRRAIDTVRLDDPAPETETTDSADPEED